MTGLGAALLQQVASNGLLGGLSDIATVVMFFVTLTVAAWAALNREQLRTVRDNNADLVQRVGILEGAETRLTAQLQALTASSEAQRVADEAKLLAADKENEILRSAATSEAHLTSIEGKLDDHHEAATKFMARALEEMHGIRVTLTGEASP